MKSTGITLQILLCSAFDFFINLREIFLVHEFQGFFHTLELFVKIRTTFFKELALQLLQNGAALSKIVGAIFNPSAPALIKMYILLTLLHTFLKILVVRIGLKIKKCSFC